MKFNPVCFWKLNTTYSHWIGRLKPESHILVTEIKEWKFWIQSRAKRQKELYETFWYTDTVNLPSEKRQWKYREQYLTQRQQILPNW